MGPAAARATGWRQASFIALHGAAGLLLASCAAVLGVDFNRVVVDAAEREDAGEAGRTGEAGPAQPAGPCVPDPAPCAGKCGDLSDACGFHECGGCPDGEGCGAGGPNVCGVGTCAPDCIGKACGAFDGCSRGCNAPCGPGQTCRADGCRCDSTCNGCCDGDILGVCREGTTQDQCGAAGVACTPCSADRPCTGRVCKKTPHFVTCEQSVSNGNCNSICTFRHLECSPSCANTLTGMGTVAAYSFENGTCATNVGAVTGVLGCSEPFGAGTQSATCCCE